jgi:YggT family protein
LDNIDVVPSVTDMTIAPLLLATILQFIQIYIVLIIVRILLTWFPTIDWMQQIASFLSVVTDPYLNLFRNLIPPVGGFDFSTILAVLLLQVAQTFVQQIAPSFLAYG